MKQTEKRLISKRESLNIRITDYIKVLIPCKIYKGNGPCSLECHNAVHKFTHLDSESSKFVPFLSLWYKYLLLATLPWWHTGVWDKRNWRRNHIEKIWINITEVMYNHAFLILCNFIWWEPNNVKHKTLIFTKSTKAYASLIPMWVHDLNRIKSNCKPALISIK